MQVAHTLNKFEGEVLELSPDEFSRWIAFFNIQAATQKKELSKAKSKAAAKRR